MLEQDEADRVQVLGTLLTALINNPKSLEATRVSAQEVLDDIEISGTEKYVDTAVPNSVVSLAIRTALDNKTKYAILRTQGE